MTASGAAEVQFLDEAPIPPDPNGRASSTCRNCGKPSRQTVIAPHDLDAEASVLSAMLLDVGAVDVVVPLLKPEHFYSRANRSIYEAALALCELGQPVDVVTVKHRMNQSGRLTESGGAEYIAQIVDSTPAVANVAHHAAIIRDRAQLRRLGFECQKFAAWSFVHRGAAKELVDRAGQAVFDLALEQNDRNFVPVGPEAELAFKRLADAAARGERLSGLSTGFYRLDAKLGGLHGGDLTLVAARPGMGKTAFVLDLAQVVAQRDASPRHGVAVFSLEMPKEQLTMRMMCSRARVDLGKARQGFLQDRDWSLLTQAVSELQDLPIFIDDSAGLTVLEARGKLRQMIAEKRRDGIEISLAIFDYIQLMQGVGDNREQEIASLSRDLKRLAKELRIPVIALAQLNRAVETRGGKDKRPQLSDLRESGALEQDADNIIFIYREDYYDEESQKRGIAELNIAKQRNGPTGRTLCRFEKAYTRFDNLNPGEEPDDDAA